jgi:WD40 repeat protein
MRLAISQILIILLVQISFGQSSPDVVLTTGHNDQVNAMRVTKNGRFLASASNDKQIKIWELATGMEFRTIADSDGRIEQLAFSPDNVLLAGTSFNNELLVWNIMTGEQVYHSISTNTRGLAFSKSGDYLYFTNGNSQLTAVETDQWTEHVIEPETYSTEFIIDTILNKAYILDHLGKIHKINLATEKSESSVQLFDSFLPPFSNSDISGDGRYIATGFTDDRLRIYDTKEGKFEYVSKPQGSKIISLAFDRRKPILYISLHSGGVAIFDVEKHKILEHTNGSGSPFATQCLTAHPDGEIILFANHDEITLYNFETRQVFNQLTRRVNRIYNMAADPNGRFLAVATDKVQLKIWDLKLNKVVDSIQAFFPCIFTRDGGSIIAMNSSLGLGRYDIETGEQIGFYPTDSELIQTLTVSKDGRYLAGAGYQGIVKVWDMDTKERIANLTGHSAGVLGLDFHPTKPWIASGSLDQTCRVWDFKEQKELEVFNDQIVQVKDVKFSPDGDQLATAAWDKTIILRNTADWAIQHKLEGHVSIINTITYGNKGKVLISGGGNNSVSKADNSIICWDTQTGKKICQFGDHRTEIQKIVLDETAPCFYSASVEGAVKYSNYETCELIATYQAIGSHEFMIHTPDNYYMASRKALNGIAFRLNGKTVPFEQFDLYLNRPDIVADRIGKSSPQLIRAYHYLYKKRLKKLDLEEGDLKLDFRIPQIQIESKPEIVTTEKSLKLWVKAWDDNYNLKQLNVYVNNVPIFGLNGYEIKENIKSIRKEITIPLINGKNKILISALNSNGVESLYESLEIVRDNEPEKHDLYIVSIGVSNYQDERFTLKYPTKDAQDILNKFDESQNRYNQVHKKLLLDEAVTLENLKSLGDFFANCTHEDLAIIFIAGHGVLDANYDYYFGTWDMDFNDPSGKGLSYGQLSDVLNQIRAYQKLLIMDTCHSGELDADEIEEGPPAELEEGDVQFRSAGQGVRKKEGLGFDNSINFTQNLFSDLRKGSGATVISSAGGAEYAMESDEWNNGLFTYVFINGINQSNADKKVYLSEIRAYVNENVQFLSKGKQIPTAREENISRDYIIFGN